MERHDWWFLDLMAVLAYAGVAAFAIRGGVEGLARVALVVPFVVFVPGYALVAAVYPRRSDPTAVPHFDDETQPPGRYAVGGVERFALSVVVSVAVVPMVAAVANFTPWGITLFPVLAGVCIATAVFTLAAAVARLLATPEERFAISPWSLGRIGTVLFGPRRDDGTTVRALNVLLVVSMLLVVASAGYAATQEPKTDQFTELYLVSDDGGKKGSPPSYDGTLNRGQSQSYTVAIENREGERTRYTVVIQLQRIETTDSGVRVKSADRLGAFEKTVGNRETYNHTHEVTPTTSGENLRIAYLLYKGDPPKNPTAENAYRVLDMPVNVSG